MMLRVLVERTRVRVHEQMGIKTVILLNACCHTDDEMTIPGESRHQVRLPQWRETKHFTGLARLKNLEEEIENMHS